MAKVVRLHIIDDSKANGVERCELPDGVTCASFSQLLHLVCQTHEQPLTPDPLHFLVPSTGRWILGEDVLAAQDDIIDELVAVSDRFRRRFGDDAATYSKLLALREDVASRSRAEKLQEFVDAVIRISHSLEEAEKRAQEIFTAKPGWLGFEIDLKEIWNLVRKKWSERQK